MRLLDLAHHWAKGTHANYQGKLAHLRAFSHAFQLPLFPPLRLSCPPHDRSIILQWAQERASLRPGRSLSSPQGDEPRASYGTIRQLRSALSYYETWRLMLTRPEQVYLDANRRVLVHECRFTDSLGHTLFAGGMGSRLGTETRPSMALLERHVLWLDADIEARFQRASASPDLQAELSRAALANVSFWLGWPRTRELFDRRFRDVTCIHPTDALEYDIPSGCGAVLYQMLETKTARDISTNIVMAYRSGRGLRPGLWFRRLCTAVGVLSSSSVSPEFLFASRNGIPWTSTYFRQTYLYPALEQQRAQGDPYLRPFDGTSPGNSIPEKFWSLFSYRRGGRTHVTRKSTSRASVDQVYEHARWRRARGRGRGSEPIDIVYREWSLRDRLRLTLKHM